MPVPSAVLLLVSGLWFLPGCGGEGDSGESGGGHVDRDCSDFPNQRSAQEYFDRNGGSPSNNFDGLDADHDGIACEDLP